MVPLCSMHKEALLPPSCQRGNKGMMARNEAGRETLLSYPTSGNLPNTDGPAASRAENQSSEPGHRRRSSALPKSNPQLSPGHSLAQGCQRSPTLLETHASGGTQGLLPTGLHVAAWMWRAKGVYLYHHSHSPWAEGSSSSCSLY